MDPDVGQWIKRKAEWISHWIEKRVQWLKREGIEFVLVLE